MTLRIEPAASLHELEADWRTLGDSGDNVFGTWEWISTWWEHFGRDRPLLLARGYDDTGAVVAILPLYLAAARPLRIVRLLGHGPSDQLGPICEPGRRADAAAALRTRLLDPALAWDLAIADELPGDADWRALGGRPLGRTTSPVLRFEEATWDDFLQARSKNLREQLGRKARRLARRGEVTYRQTRDPAELDDDLATLYRLHDERWQDAGGTRAFERRKLFHRDFAARALARGHLRLRFVEVDGKPVAALYNLRLGAAESNYQAGRDLAFTDESVGLLLHTHAMRDALETGCTEYRFLRGDESYKLRLANHDPGLVAFSLVRGTAARALLPALAKVPHLRRPFRRRVPAPYAWGTGSAPMWGDP